jgi:hypothetical protein
MNKSQITISLKNNNEDEQRTKTVLERMLNKYFLDKWILCSQITVEHGANGKAFPFITLSTWKDNEVGLLAQFLHEQIHWIEKNREKEMSNAIKELKEIFHDAPINRPEGGGSEISTYKHLIVCRLEFLALKELLGEEKARAIVLGNKNYTWIRKTIVDSALSIDPVIKKHFPATI